MPARISDWLGRIMIDARGKIPRSAQEQNDGVVKTTRPEPENQNCTPENFFDSDFLRKLERLHLIAKRLSWAGAKGEHAVSRKGFSLEFSDYRRYQRGDDLRCTTFHHASRRHDGLVLPAGLGHGNGSTHRSIAAAGSCATGPHGGSGRPPSFDDPVHGFQHADPIWSHWRVGRPGSGLLGHGSLSGHRRADDA